MTTPVWRMAVEVDGMVAVHCVRAIETALVLVPGITWHEVTVGRIALDHDGRATDAALRDAVAVAGFRVRAIRSERRLPVR
ncbi:MAG: heavy-metal-associated domain-containing protein [Gemmatimonadaceae bacterium]|jgi:copper chaperone CopZ|nr:heavy-metal-associated domain-containing protein [Gemmatimonadaceae bacterium]